MRRLTGAQQILWTMKHLFAKWWPMVLMIAFVAISWHAWLAPSYNRADYLHTELDRMRGELANKKMRTNQLPKFRSELDSHEKDIQLLSQMLPDEPDLQSLMLKFAREAADKNLTFSSFTPGATRNEDFYSATPVRISFTGRLDAIVDLITRSQDFVEVSILRTYVIREIVPGKQHKLDGQLLVCHSARPNRSIKKKRKK
jgi:Tfp pilus assembly protein PilO